MSAPLYFIRHGETAWNAEGRLQGQRDIPLNDLGRDQARDAGRILTRLGLDPTGHAFWASPLLRTLETMRLMREAMSLDPEDFRTDDRLKELAFGEWEGLTWPEARQRDEKLARAREAGKWTALPPGGESYVMLTARLMPFLATLNGPTVLVSHGGIGRVLMRELGGKSEAQAGATYIHQGVVYRFQGGKAELIKR